MPRRKAEGAELPEESIDMEESELPEGSELPEESIDEVETDVAVFERLKLPYCPKCKQQLQSSYMGHPICPIQSPDCDRNV